jgi:L-threonylcarbamoyladenylate synthase
MAVESRMSLALRSDADAVRIAPAVAAHLAAGRVLAYPTETVYGLGALPTEQGLDALAALKGRHPDKPFLLLVSDLDMLHATGLVLNQAARVLAREFWPGPLTLVLQGGEGILPDRLRSAGGGIAVRWTALGPLARLIGLLGGPITSTSANRPGGPTAPGVEAVAETFPDELANGTLLVIDGGVLGNVPPSTLVDCTQPVPRLIREGAIPRDELRRRAGSMAP